MIDEVIAKLSGSLTALFIGLIFAGIYHFASLQPNIMVGCILGLNGSIFGKMAEQYVRRFLLW